MKEQCKQTLRLLSVCAVRVDEGGEISQSGQGGLSSLVVVVELNGVIGAGNKDRMKIK